MEYLPLRDEFVASLAGRARHLRRGARLSSPGLLARPDVRTTPQAQPVDGECGRPDFRAIEVEVLTRFSSHPIFEPSDFRAIEVEVLTRFSSHRGRGVDPIFESS